MRWDVHANNQPIAGRSDIKVLLDGSEPEAIRAFDTNGGWARVLCREVGCGGPGFHADPNNPDEAHEQTLYGAVEVVWL